MDLFNFESFAEHFFKITDKSGRVIPFRLNRAQRHVLNRINAQQESLGYVRALILKGRQQGISTLIQAWILHKVLTQKGLQAFILTHHSDATRQIFDMTKRFYDNLPSGLAPSPSQKSHNRLNFDKIKSGYRVGTAGSKEVGRSMTIQVIHCSEYAFYDDVEAIKKGILQTVADIDGTAIFKESTANGRENAFCEEWEAATAHQTDYVPIFVPWYWQDEYKTTTDNFEPDDEEKDLLHEYGHDGLTIAHLAWRRSKLSQFTGDYDQKRKNFNQEYPFCATDAFISSVQRIFISRDAVHAARKNHVESDAALIIGVDPAISNNDRCTICFRRGREVQKFDNFYNMNTQEIAVMIRELILKYSPQHVFIDSIGVGAGVVDRLREMGMECAIGIDVRRKANNKDRYANLRAELWAYMSEWLHDETGVSLPDTPEIEKDLCSLSFEYNKRTQLLIESKKEAKRRGVQSPDLADALAMTFAYGTHAGYSDNFYNPFPGQGIR